MDYDAAIKILRAMALLSVLLGSLPLLTCALFGWRRRFPQRLVIHISAAAVLMCCSLFVGSFEASWFCPIQAVLLEFTALATLFWWLCISYNFWLVVVRHRSFEHCRAKEPFYVAFSWGLSGFITVSATITNALDRIPVDDSVFCWVSFVPDPDVFNYYHYLFFHGWLVLVFLLNLRFWPESFLTIYRIHEMNRSYQPQMNTRSSLPQVSEAGHHQEHGTDPDDVVRRKVPPGLMASHVAHVFYIVAFLVVYVVLFTFRVWEDTGSEVSDLLKQLRVAACASTGVITFFVFSARRTSLLLVSFANHYLQNSSHANCCCCRRNRTGRGRRGGWQRSPSSFNLADFSPKTGYQSVEHTTRPVSRDRPQRIDLSVVVPSLSASAVDSPIPTPVPSSTTTAVSSPPTATLTTPAYGTADDEFDYVFDGPPIQDT